MTAIYVDGDLVLPHVNLLKRRRRQNGDDDDDDDDDAAFMQTDTHGD